MDALSGHEHTDTGISFDTSHRFILHKEAMKKPRLLIVADEMDMLRLLSRAVRADIACEG